MTEGREKHGHDDGDHTIRPEVHDEQREEESLAPISRDKAERFYDRLRLRISSYLGSKGAAMGKSSDFLLLVPDVFILMFRLISDHRVSARHRVLLGTGIAYFVLPIDLIPEAIVGPVGFLDDLVFAVYILDTMINDTDEAILREHWSGSEDVLVMMRRVLEAADKLVSRDVLDKIRGWLR